MCNQALGDKLKISFEVVLDFGEKKLHTVRGGIARLSSENRMVTCRIGMFGRRCFFGNLYVITCYSPKLQLFNLFVLYSRRYALSALETVGKSCSGSPPCWRNDHGTVVDVADTASSQGTLKRAISIANGCHPPLRPVVIDGREGEAYGIVKRANSRGEPQLVFL